MKNGIFWWLSLCLITLTIVLILIILLPPTKDSPTGDTNLPHPPTINSNTSNPSNNNASNKTKQTPNYQITFTSTLPTLLNQSLTTLLQKQPHLYQIMKPTTNTTQNSSDSPEVVPNLDPQKNIVFSFSMTNKLTNPPRKGFYLTPVLYYKNSQNNINTTDLTNYEILVAKPYQNLLEQYLAQAQITPKAIITLPLNNPNKLNIYLEDLTTKLAKSTKERRQTVAFIPLNHLTPRLQPINLNGTNLLRELNTKQQPIATSTILLFTPQIKLPDKLSNPVPADLQQLVTSFDEIITKYYPDFDPALLSTVNMTGVTAITRGAAIQTDFNNDPAYMARKISSFLADADLTHTSNEVSFKKNCKAESITMSFCADPSYIQALEISGIDLIELTGNHNNDKGAVYNAQSIDTYISRKWGYFGGGRNKQDAAKPFIKQIKGTTVGFLGYNYANGSRSGAVASNSRAGANSYHTADLKKDIAQLKKQADVVIVTFQFIECYAYTPNNTVCYRPIAKQQKVFRQAIDWGADIVIGTQAHQPQTFEYYNGKMIYYGLGNLFFDQMQWLGTRQGLVLTHYFYSKRYLTTKVTTTLYDHTLQPHVSTNKQRQQLLESLW